MDQSFTLQTQAPANMGAEPAMNFIGDYNQNMINNKNKDKEANAPSLSEIHRLAEATRDKIGASPSSTTTTTTTATTTTTTTSSSSSTTTTAAAAAGILSGGDVRVLGLDEYKQAAECLADAFAQDHVAWYFLDTPDRADWTREQKWQLHVEIFEYIVYAHLLKGLVLAAGPNYDCVALWMPPASNMDDLLTICRSGMWRLNYKLSKEGRRRFFTEFLPLLHDTKLQVMGERDDASWYLVYLGTKSSSRGKGHARKVIEHVSRQADADGRACYLESSNYVNRIIYGKLGYQMVKSIYLQRNMEQIELDIMVREPIVKKRDSMFGDDSE